MTDQMETRKRKLINIRHMDFILDDDDDVGGDNCNDVAHIDRARDFLKQLLCKLWNFCLYSLYYRPVI